MKEEPLNNDEQQLFKRRDFIIKSVISIPFLGCAWRLWNLQVKEGEKYKELAKGNRIRLNSVPAPRGIIYDRNGVILAKNIPSYNLVMIREDTDDIPETLRKISLTLKIKLEVLQNALENQQYIAKYEPLTLYKDLSWYQVALVSAYQEEFPGTTIEISSRRYYPNLSSGAHIYGYMNRITRSQLKRLPIKKLMSAKVIGQEGIENIYNDQLIGYDGGVQVEVDSIGKVVKTLKSIDPIPGNDIKLCIDSRLQKKVESIFGNREGAAIIMNPQNGEVYSMVSLPAYDPNEFSQGLTPKRWKYLSNHPSNILHNKCIQGTYSPGSTFKMLVAAAALELGIIDRETKHDCEGHYRFSRTVVHCWKRSGHGELDVVEALENSCNIFFYKIAMEVGVDNIYKYAHKMGLGSLTDIDLSNEKSGVIPNKDWKQKRYGEQWYPGETLPVGIGQGYVTVTPVQLINYINVIANNGSIVKPRVTQAIIDKQGQLAQDGKKPSPDLIYTDVEKHRVDIDPVTLAIVREGMRRNVQGSNGTGKHAFSEIVPISGKTGTTQVVSYKTRARIKREKGVVDKKFFDHAWFTGFAPSYNPKVSVSLIIENGKSGRNAATLVKQIMEYYFTQIEPIAPQEPKQEDPQKNNAPDTPASNHKPGVESA